MINDLGFTVAEGDDIPDYDAIDSNFTPFEEQVLETQQKFLAVSISLFVLVLSFMVTATLYPQHSDDIKMSTDNTVNSVQEQDSGIDASDSFTSDTLVPMKSSKPKRCWIAETGLLLVFGVISGASLHLMPRSPIYRGILKMMEFDSTLFFMVLLPPIIFNSGLAVKQDAFARNLDAILSLAFLGTVISTVVVTLVLYLSGVFGICYRTSAIEAAAFGSMASATDPVTVLAVFQSLKVDQNLLAVVFGESVLNDVVAIVLYDTIVAHESNVTIAATSNSSLFASIFHGFGQFLLIFFGSVIIGVGIGFLAALAFKSEKTKDVEKCLTLVIPYLSYSFAEGFRLSGIVAILFCGMTISRYALRNMTPSSKQMMIDFYKSFSTISEMLVFIYLGLAFVSNLYSNSSVEDSNSDEKQRFHGIALIGCFISRQVAVYSICYLVNCWRNRNEHRRLISSGEMTILVFAGLRGGMAFALSTKAKIDLLNLETAEMFEMSMLIVVFVTVIFFGSNIDLLVKYFQLYEDDCRESKPQEVNASNRKASWTLIFQGLMYFEENVIIPSILSPTALNELRQYEPTEELKLGIEMKDMIVN